MERTAKSESKRDSLWGRGSLWGGAHHGGGLTVGGLTVREGSQYAESPKALSPANLALLPSGDLETLRSTENGTQMHTC